MRLSRNKNGTIGRHVRSMGETAQIAVPAQASYASSNIVSYNTIDKDQAYWDNQEKIRREKFLAEQAKQNDLKAKRAAERAQMETLILQQQTKAYIDPLQDALKRKFALDAVSPETERVVKSIKADFYDREMVPAPQELPKYGAVNPDFSNFDITGHPLTRDGRYGTVTDFDRIVKGRELDNADVKIVAGTMLRELPGTRRATAQMGSSWFTPSDLIKFSEYVPANNVIPSNYPSSTGDGELDSWTKYVYEQNKVLESQNSGTSYIQEFNPKNWKIMIEFKNDNFVVYKVIRTDMAPYYQLTSAEEFKQFISKYPDANYVDMTNAVKAGASTHEIQTMLPTSTSNVSTTSASAKSSTGKKIALTAAAALGILFLTRE